MSPFFLNEASSDAAMTYFYGRLFAAEPEIRAMFPATMAAQRRRFYQAICRIAASPDIAPPDIASPDAANPELDEYLAALGRSHRKFGVRAGHYEAIKAALEATFRRFPPDAPQWREENWRKAFDHAAETMISAAEHEAANAPAWWTAEVIAAERPVPHVAVLTIRTDRPFPYLPGQHVSVQTPRWPRVWRCYSIANAPRSADPDDGGTLTLHVRAIPGGLVSTALLHAAPGDTLVLGPAEGTMTPDPATERDILCLAGGTGLAPVKAIAEAVARQGSTGEHDSARRRKIALYFGARTEADLYDLPALRAMESSYPELRVHTAISGAPAPGNLNDTIPNLAVHAEWRNRDVYISGPTPMITRTVHRLRQLGAPAERLHFDLPS
ncbi:MAG TPA: FAD-binding oxidoreductase [Trebonia sp.]|jgi:NAD(P)H-flavin reductase/hemoglobin-like flavoprotein|nr:FAD-binding oxidoreductase [Trebonia sp.]